MRAKYTVLVPAAPADTNTASGSASARVAGSKSLEGVTQ
jgi:hypothetical protein